MLCQGLNTLPHGKTDSVISKANSVKAPVRPKLEKSSGTQSWAYFLEKKLIMIVIARTGNEFQEKGRSVHMELEMEGNVNFVQMKQKPFFGPL